MQTTWIVLIVLAIVVVAAIAWWAGQRRRSRRLKEQFGSEYDRTVQATGKQSTAESELEARQERVEALEIRPLDPGQRDRFLERWRVIQAMFVDDPAGAIVEADNIVGEVMETRGYPVGDFEQRAADISVNHPQVVDHYRTAHAITTRQRGGQADTEQLRQAMVHYRALVSDLLDLPSGDGGSTAASPSAGTDVEGTDEAIERDAAPANAPDANRAATEVQRR